MANEPEQIRLPELPVFKRYSLALRQEYASAEEISAVLQRTSAKLEELLENAERKAREALEKAEEIDHEAEAVTTPMDEAVESEQLDEELDPGDERPFWEAPEALPSKAPKVAAGKVPTQAKPKPKTKTKTKTKTKAKHSVVPVGHHGRPLDALSRSAKKGAAPAGRAGSSMNPKPTPKPKPKETSREKAATAKKVSASKTARGSRRR